MGGEREGVQGRNGRNEGGEVVILRGGRQRSRRGKRHTSSGGYDSAGVGGQGAAKEAKEKRAVQGAVQGMCKMGWRTVAWPAGQAAV
mgnify:CR=1 FL=1